MWLVLHRGLVPLRLAHCTILPPGIRDAGDDRCYTMGHPYLWIGVLVLIVAIVGGAILWRIGKNLNAGRSVGPVPA
jgi:hypothetical protein